jgi:tetratricopeptide (TPR) repeat protein
MIIAILLILALPICAGQLTSPAQQSAFPPLVHSLNYEAIHQADKKLARGTLDRLLVPPLISCIAEITNNCQDSSTLSQTLHEYAFALEEPSEEPLIRGLQAYAFSIGAHAAQQYGDLETFCSLSCSALHKKPKFIDPTLGLGLANALQHDDQLRELIHRELPAPNVYQIGHWLVADKPYFAQMSAYAAQHKPPLTAADRALLAWQAEYYNNNKPGKIDEGILDDALTTCARTLPSCFERFIQSQYLHYAEVPAIRGKFAYLLYLDMNSEKSCNQRFNLLLEAVHNGHEEAFDTAYATCRTLWDEQPHDAHILLCELATKGHAPTCDYICKMLDALPVEHNGLAMHAFMEALTHSHNEQIQRYAIDHYLHLIVMVPQKVGKIRDFLTSYCQLPHPNKQLLATAQLLLCTADKTIDTSIPALQAFIRKQEKAQKKTGASCSPTFYAAHLDIATLYGTKATDLAALCRGLTSPSDKKKVQQRMKEYLERIKECQGIAMQAQNPHTRYRAERNNIYLELRDIIASGTLKQGHRTRLELAKNKILKLLAELHENPLAEDTECFGHRESVSLQTAAHVDLLVDLAYFEKLLGNTHMEHSYLVQAFRNHPTSRAVLEQIELIVMNALNSNNQFVQASATILLNNLEIAHPECPYIYLHRAALAMNNPEKVIGFYAKAGELGLPLGWKKAGYKLENLGNPEKALHYHELALAACPENRQYQREVASLAEQTGHYPRALELFTVLAEHDANAAYRIGLLHLEGKVGDDAGTYSPETALNFFGHAVALAQKSPVKDRDRVTLYQIYYKFAEAFVRPVVNFEEFKTLVDTTARQSNIGPETQATGIIALAQQHIFKAQAAENEMLRNIQLNVARGYLEQAQKRYTAYAPYIDHLMAMSILPPSTPLDQDPAQHSNFEKLREIYTHMIQKGQPQNFFVQRAHDLLKTFDEYVFNDTSATESH